MNPQLEALGMLHVNTAPNADEVWIPLSGYHVDKLHAEVSSRLTRAMNTVSSHATAPVAVVVRGERGTGKTHLLGWVRQEIQAKGGFFFYIKLVTGRDFWESATGSLVDSLYRKDEGGQEQLFRLLEELSRRTGLDDETRSAVTGEQELKRVHVDAFVRGIRRLDRQVGNEAADTARALVLVASSGEAVEIGTSYLALNDDAPGQRAAWGLSSQSRPAQLVLRDLTRLFSLAGPLVFAFDQIDNLVAVAETSVGTAASSSGERRSARRLSSDIASGLMELREEARRTLMIIACQPDTWRKISESAVLSALDRFEVLPDLGAIPDEATAAAIVSSRFRSGYKAASFTPPYPTWPISADALAEAGQRYTARRLLIRVSAHITDCLRAGTVSELTSLTASEPTKVAAPVRASVGALDEFTERFEKLRGEADDLEPLDKGAEDRLMPGLLGAALRSLITELGGDEKRFLIETTFGGKAALHARLRYILDEGKEKEIHWSFRAIAADNAIAVQTRMRNAMVEAGLEAGLSIRHLVLLRNTKYPGGTKMGEMRDDFEARGGLPIPIGGADLRTFAALRTMLATPSAGLDAWLKLKHPVTDTEFFTAALSDVQHYLDVAPVNGEELITDNGGTPPLSQADPGPSEITLGTTIRGGRPFSVAIEQLRKHTVVVGAAGSGKTVLVKRIIEQCALRNVSAIVLDPNDDLGRLGDPWPSTPEGWSDAEDREAQRYFTQTEVVTWTPGLNRGRPLSFHPLPDFGPVLGDEDDFARLLTSTVAALAPQARVRGDNARATQQLGVLRRALEKYAREGGRTLSGLVELLAEPPGDIVNSRTSRFAVQMADTLEAAMETDPLFGESGAPADPGVLLTPSPGKSTRISIISFVGLSGDGPSQFVSRLQAALFSWFKAHPTNDRPLGGLLVMDEAQNFVPSGSSTPSTESTVDLIRQIRKYGLGIILASQAPRGINHQALGNTANQFIGRLTAPAQINAVESMAHSRNAVLDNLGGLQRGTFYASGEGTTFSKIQVPICLSHHTGPLQEEEVIDRARGRA